MPMLLFSLGSQGPSGKDSNFTFCFWRARLQGVTGLRHCDVSRTSRQNQKFNVVVGARHLLNTVTEIRTIENTICSGIGGQLDVVGGF